MRKNLSVCVFSVLGVAASLAIFAGCEDDSAVSTVPPGSFEGGSFDGGSFDGGSRPDAGGIDAADAAPTEVSVSLSASATNVTTEGDVTLTATVTGGTATSVEFFETNDGGKT